MCWQLGFAHPDQLTKHLNLWQLAEWIAWLRREPRGERRADLRSALASFRIHQSLVDDPMDPDAFVLKFDGPISTDPETEQLIQDFFNPNALPLLD